MTRKGIADSIFLHSGWRSGSTYLWNKFRELSETCAYYEPFHESTASYTKAFVAGNRPNAWHSRHPKLASPYATEYLPLVRSVGVPEYRDAFALSRYFSKPDELPELAYLQKLQTHAWQNEQVPVFGFCRSLGRAASIKSHLSGVHLLLMRDPLQQWLSCRSYRIGNSASAYFELSHFLILALAAKGTSGYHLARDLNIPVIAGKNVPKQLAKLQKVIPKIDDEWSFRVFLTVYVLSYLYALPYADLILDIDCMSLSAEYRKHVAQQCAKLTGLSVNFEDCRLPECYLPTLGFDVETVTWDVWSRVLDQVCSAPVVTSPTTMAVLFNKLVAASNPRGAGERPAEEGVAKRDLDVDTFKEVTSNGEGWRYRAFRTTPTDVLQWVKNLGHP